MSIPAFVLFAVWAGQSDLHIVPDKYELLDSVNACYQIQVYSDAHENITAQSDYPPELVTPAYEGLSQFFAKNCHQIKRNSEDEMRIIYRVNASAILSSDRTYIREFDLAISHRDKSLVVVRRILSQPKPGLWQHASLRSQAISAYSEAIQQLAQFLRCYR